MFLDASTTLVSWVCLNSQQGRKLIYRDSSLLLSHSHCMGEIRLACAASESLLGSVYITLNPCTGYIFRSCRDHWPSTGAYSRSSGYPQCSSESAQRKSQEAIRPCYSSAGSAAHHFDDPTRSPAPCELLY